MTDDWITTAEAAQITGYHQDYIRKLLYASKVHGRKFGTVWQVSRDSLLAHLHSMDIKGEKRGPKTDKGG